MARWPRPEIKAPIALGDWGLLVYVDSEERIQAGDQEGGLMTQNLTLSIKNGVPITADEQAARNFPVFRDHWISTLLVFVVCLVFYLANGRHIGSGDCVPATYLPIALARGDGPWLDRFRSFLESPTGQLPGYCELSRGHIVSRYPIGPGLILAPVVIPQVLIWDKLKPGWDQTPESFQLTARRMAKLASATLAAIGVAMIWKWLRPKFGTSAASLATVSAAFGSDLWSVASQAAWQHGPAVFCLMVSILILESNKRSRTRAALAGSFTAMIVVCRPVDLPIAIAVWLYVLHQDSSTHRWFAITASVVALMWSGWNLYFFDHMTGGYSEIEKMHGWAHGVKGSWSTPLTTGIAGSLFSPSHGLLIYCPWVLLSGFGLWSIWKHRQTDHLLMPRMLTLCLLPTLIMLSKYSCWWGGHCFGPRFWIDTTPILAMLAAAAWQWAESLNFRSRSGLRCLFLVALVWSAGLQSVAVWSYPTSWHSSPTNADKDHKRLWDWHDNEVTRGLHEGSHRPQWSGWF